MVMLKVYAYLFPVLSEPNNSANKEECEYSEYTTFIKSNKALIDFKVIRKATRENSVLGKMYLFIETGWPEKVCEELKPYFTHTNELSCKHNVIMWR